ncbi:hypothetical protein [Pseudomonas viridiflava]|uniref:hypothetical protein n=1 Tax=Pseudomonas viridiflava TaxID=33069 RepID=UPI000F0483B9|nr:hypothetical protein [Pseudomonas viridiflava]
MEYIVNGDFATGEFEPWEQFPLVEILTEGTRSYARFGGDGRLIQRWLIPAPPPNGATFSLDITCSEDAFFEYIEASLWFVVAGELKLQRFNVHATTEWRRASISLNLPASLTRVELIFHRQPGFPGNISITNVSFSDEVSDADVGIESLPEVQS